ncbi:hypothetical protein GPECTOR_18g104 [Gonium pectorale]|uniref:FAD/NAD(P)-binding domain-containing protein n=1 Tax=Gonium pectorale TaxID=33097 RepID=A0A150GJG7_GONPE|nr:hypothetical protein GPECTOR_18g104 [Gonium pectorale]|eukprot:KXZ49946.1 hypothetical protein GPECTOR_18g104 [Gonium pectorale]
MSLRMVRDVRLYLAAYAVYRNVQDHVRLSCQLCHLAFDPDVGSRGRWRATFQDLAHGKKYQAAADFVIMCTGACLPEALPEVQQGPSTRVFHALRVTPEDVAACGGDVAVVGDGRPALDCASSLVLLRRGKGVRLLSARRALHATLQPHYTAPCPGAMARVLRAPTKRRFWAYAKAKAKVSSGSAASATPSKPAQLVVWAPSLADPRVMPFLEPGLRRALLGGDLGGGEVVLYRGMLHPDVPGLAFVGLEACSSSPLLLLELQAQWLAAHLAARAQLPDPMAMREDINRQRAWRAAALASHLASTHGSWVRAAEAAYMRQLLGDLDGLVSLTKIDQKDDYLPGGCALGLLHYPDPDVVLVEPKPGCAGGSGSGGNGGGLLSRMGSCFIGRSRTPERCPVSSRYERCQQGIAATIQDAMATAAPTPLPRRAPSRQRSQSVGRGGASRPSRSSTSGSLGGASGDGSGILRRVLGGLSVSRPAAGAATPPLHSPFRQGYRIEAQPQQGTEPALLHTDQAGAAVTAVSVAGLAAAATDGRLRRTSRSRSIGGSSCGGGGASFSAVRPRLALAVTSPTLAPYLQDKLRRAMTASQATGPPPSRDASPPIRAGSTRMCDAGTLLRGMSPGRPLSLDAAPPPTPGLSVAFASTTGPPGASPVCAAVGSALTAIGRRSRAPRTSDSSSTACTGGGWDPSYYRPPKARATGASSVPAAADGSRNGCVGHSRGLVNSREGSAAVAGSTMTEREHRVSQQLRRMSHSTGVDLSILVDLVSDDGGGSAAAGRSPEGLLEGETVEAEVVGEGPQPRAEGAVAPGGGLAALHAPGPAAIQAGVSEDLSGRISMPVPYSIVGNSAYVTGAATTAATAAPVPVPPPTFMDSYGPDLVQASAAKPLMLPPASPTGQPSAAGTDEAAAAAGPAIPRRPPLRGSSRLFLLDCSADSGVMVQSPSSRGGSHGPSSNGGTPDVSGAGGGGCAVEALESQLAALRTHLLNPALFPFPSVSAYQHNAPRLPRGASAAAAAAIAELLSQPPPSSSPPQLPFTPLLARTRGSVCDLHAVEGRLSPIRERPREPVGSGGSSKEAGEAGDRALNAADAAAEAAAYARELAARASAAAIAVKTDMETGGGGASRWSSFIVGKLAGPATSSGPRRPPRRSITTSFIGQQPVPTRLRLHVPPQPIAPRTLASATAPALAALTAIDSLTAAAGGAIPATPLSPSQLAPDPPARVLARRPSGGACRLGSLRRKPPSRHASDVRDAGAATARTAIANAVAAADALAAFARGAAGASPRSPAAAPSQGGSPLGSAPATPQSALLGTAATSVGALQASASGRLPEAGSLEHLMASRAEAAYVAARSNAVALGVGGKHKPPRRGVSLASLLGFGGGSNGGGSNGGGSNGGGSNGGGSNGGGSNGGGSTRGKGGGRVVSGGLLDMAAEAARLPYSQRLGSCGARFSSSGAGALIRAASRAEEAGSEVPTQTTSVAGATFTRASFGKQPSRSRLGMAAVQGLPDAGPTAAPVAAAALDSACDAPDEPLSEGYFLQC